MLVDSATLSATCIRAYLQEMSPTEVIPSDLVEVWKYLEKAPAVVEFMTRSAFRRGASTALSLGLAHFPEDFDLDDVMSGSLVDWRGGPVRGSQVAGACRRVLGACLGNGRPPSLSGDGRRAERPRAAAS